MYTTYIHREWNYIIGYNLLLLFICFITRVFYIFGLVLIVSEVFITLFEHFFYFLVLQESSSSFCILSVLDPESTILSRSLVSFTSGIKLENKDWVQMVCFSFILSSILTGRCYPVNSLDGFHYNLHGSFNEYEEKHSHMNSLLLMKKK